MSPRRTTPRLGPPLGDKYLLRQRCRHGKHKTDRVELAYAVAGSVCNGCLVDHPAVAMLNTAQARELRELLRDYADTSTTDAQLAPVVGPALIAMGRADDLCALVRRERRMTVQGKKAGLLVVCSCLKARIVILTFGCMALGEVCDGCGNRLPSVHWLPEDEAGDFVDELPTVLGHRRALTAARGPAPVVDYSAD